MKGSGSIAPDDERSPLHVRPDLVHKRREGGGRSALGNERSASARWRLLAGPYFADSTGGHPAGRGLRPALGLESVAERGVMAACSGPDAFAGVPGSLAIAGFLQSERDKRRRRHARTYLDNFSDSAATPLRAYVEGLRLAVRTAAA